MAPRRLFTSFTESTDSPGGGPHVVSDQEDHRHRRCPRLGHDVPFRYCRTQEAEKLCPRVLDCWWERFDIETFLRSCYPGEDVDALLHPASQPKVATILELIEAAKARRGASPSPPTAPDDSR